MKSKELEDKNLIRVLDILEQVKKLNGMIKLHSTNLESEFMVSQYIDIKKRFLNELKEILSDYEIEVLVKDIAA